MKIQVWLILVFGVLTLNPALGLAQGRPTEVSRFVNGLNQKSAGNTCDGKFSVKEQRRLESGFIYAVSYTVKGRSVYQQSIKSDIETYVDLVPIKIGKCAALFLRYLEGAAGRYNDSFIVFKSGKLFSSIHVGGSYDGGFRPEELDSDGEFELIESTREASNCGFAECCFPHWERIFHVNVVSKKLVEEDGRKYPAFYSSVAKKLREYYEREKDNEYISRNCKQVFLDLAAKAERLSHSK